MTTASDPMEQVERYRAVTKPGRCTCEHGVPNDRGCEVHGAQLRAEDEKPAAQLGFGIPVLRDMVRENMTCGMSQEQAFNAVVDYAELRSEAIQALRAAVEPYVMKPSEEAAMFKAGTKTEGGRNER